MTETDEIRRELTAADDGLYDTLDYLRSHGWRIVDAGAWPDYLLSWLEASRTAPHELDTSRLPAYVVDALSDALGGRYRLERRRSRTSDPSTSRTAAQRARRTARSVAAKLLEAYDHAERVVEDSAVVSFAWRGMTAEEAAQAVGRPSAWRRVSELLADGLLSDVHELDEAAEEWRLVTRPNRSGAQARVLTITDAGREELRRLRHDVRISP